MRKQSSKPSTPRRRCSRLRKTPDTRGRLLASRCHRRYNPLGLVNGEGTIRRLSEIPHIERVEPRFYFQIEGGIDSDSDPPHPIPPPTFANGVLHIRGTDFDDFLYIRTHDFPLGIVTGSNPDSLVLDASGAWRQVRSGEDFTEQHYIVDTDRGPTNTYYHAPASRLSGIVIETAGGADRISYAPYLDDDMGITLIGGSGNDQLNAGTAAAATVIGGAGRDVLSAPGSGRS